MVSPPHPHILALPRCFPCGGVSAHPRAHARRAAATMTPPATYRQARSPARGDRRDRRTEGL